MPRRHSRYSTKMDNQLRRTLVNARPSDPFSCDHSWCERCSPRTGRTPAPSLTMRPEPCSRQDDDAAGRIATVGSIASGILFCTAWDLFVGTDILAARDCMVWGHWAEKLHGTNCSDASHYADMTNAVAPVNLVSGAYWAPGILSTAGLIGLNAISWEAVMEEGAFGDGVVVCARVWTMASLCLLFGGLGLSLWCLVTDLQCNVNNLECIPPIDGKVPEDAFVWHWGGINTFIQNLLILFAAFLFRFTRRSGEHAL